LIKIYSSLLICRTVFDIFYQPVLLKAHDDMQKD